ncbi:MAG: hypothetical protein H0V22_09420, partial [Solirubrobacterales bacterium]|nr:hypothetical protein [Solirubrobacterales bacterium]
SRGGPTQALSLVAPDMPNRAASGPWRGSELVLAKEGLGALLAAPEGASGLVLELAVLAWRRWRHATTTLFLAQACEQALRTEAVGEPQRLAVVATLAAFRGDELGSFVLLHDMGGPLPEILDRAAMEHVTSVAPPPTERRVELVTRLMESAGGTEWSGLITDWTQKTSLVLPEIMQALPPELRGPAFYILSPEPLQMLLRQALAVPDSLPL